MPQTATATPRRARRGADVRAKGGRIERYDARPRRWTPNTQPPLERRRQLARTALERWQPRMERLNWASLLPYWRGAIQAGIRDTRATRRATAVGWLYKQFTGPGMLLEPRGGLASVSLIDLVSEFYPARIDRAVEKACGLIEIERADHAVCG